MIFVYSKQFIKLFYFLSDFGRCFGNLVKLCTAFVFFFICSRNVDDISPRTLFPCLFIYYIFYRLISVFVRATLNRSSNDHNFIVIVVFIISMGFFWTFLFRDKYVVSPTNFATYLHDGNVFKTYRSR